MKVVFFGTPEFAVPSLKSLINSSHEILAVVTQPDRQSGRGRKVRISPVKHAALENGLRVMQPEKVRNQGFINDVGSLEPLCIVVIAYGQILPPELIQMPRFGCVNVHASLLPKYRGAAPINWAIIRGEEKTGVTTMLMDEGMDTGDIILQKETVINHSDTAGSLSGKLAAMGAELILTTLQGLENKTLVPYQQSGETSYAPIMKKTDALIDWSQSAGEIRNAIRGMNPWPGAYSYLRGERIKILSAESILDPGGCDSVSKGEKGKAGIIDSASKDELLVCAGTGAVSLCELQPPGKSVMSVKAFLQGRKVTKGMRFKDKQ